MHTSIFDDHGDCWDARSQTLRAQLSCPTPDFDFLSYVVDNLGFVVVSRPQAGAMRLRLRPEVAAPAALAAALFALADEDPRRVIVSRSADGGGDELFAGMGQAIARIGQLTAAPGRTHQFLNKERPVEELAGESHPLAALLAVWEARGRIYDSASYADVLNRLLGGRFMAVMPVHDHLTIVDVGSGFVSYHETWRRRAIGRPLEDQPDYAYGVWARDLFRDVLCRGAARLDDVDAVIRRPHLDDTIHLRYRCLTLPYRYAESAVPCVLCASVIDETVDLRGGMDRAGRPAIWALPSEPGNGQARRRTGGRSAVDGLGIGHGRAEAGQGFLQIRKKLAGLHPDQSTANRSQR